MRSPVNHGDGAPPCISRLSADYPMTGGTSLSGIAVVGVCFIQGNGPPCAIDTNFAAENVERCHAGRVP
jgi:hypothetical protein